MKKLNRIFIGCNIFITIFFSCSNVSNKNNKVNIFNHVLVESVDTIFTDTSYHLQTILVIDKKQFTLINNFRKLQNFNSNDLFDINSYIGLSVIYKNKSLKNFIGFEDQLCIKSIQNFFAFFAGNEIDNPEGYNYLHLTDQNIEYYITYGYFLGCNGSYCNNGAILILYIKNDLLEGGYLFGVDKTILDISNLKAEIIDGNLQLGIDRNKVVNADKIQNISLLLTDKIRFINQSQNPMMDYGLFCIKK